MVCSISDSLQTYSPQSSASSHQSSTEPSFSGTCKMQIYELFSLFNPSPLTNTTHRLITHLALIPLYPEYHIAFHC